MQVCVSDVRIERASARVIDRFEDSALISGPRVSFSHQVTLDRAALIVYRYHIDIIHCVSSFQSALLIYDP